ncbi:clasp N terminal-domain-containing protein [Boletus reticuloceps]|uniref:Clasp N terminal-domain-containing protein n=1 Tax=Boletus reticuloceps TaxID=495285 RepID=A0A8I2YXM5_9AGAM|nr:clasp N terminal-domain-containing protein [Boletus reticuloceps]
MADTSSTTQEPSQEVLDPALFVPPSPLPHPRVVIEFCDRFADRLHRATWVSTELLLTFPSPALAAVSVMPLNSEDTAGRFRVWLEVGNGTPILMWDRKLNGGFPELKELTIMNNDRLDKLINQCKGNDIELKLDAVTKLQAEFETGVEITDPEPLVAVLKACLRIANQHLTTATLSAIPPLLPLIVHRPNGTPTASARPFSSSSSTSSSSGSSYDVSVLRHLARKHVKRSSSSVDSRSAPPHRHSKLGNGKGHEPPIVNFERFLRDNGLSSKVWRVREQSILVLVNIRRAHHTFPIRPYLSLLVDALEDTDGNVRACATPSIIELFTGPGVTDAARADIKKEMTKKGVRKAIVDNVLNKLMSSSRTAGASTPLSEGSENGDAGTKEYIPPSLMLQNRRPTGGAPAAAPMVRAISHGNVKEQSRPASRTATVASPPLPQPSSETASTVEACLCEPHRYVHWWFLHYLSECIIHQGKETEHNWTPRERCIQRVRGMLRGDIHTRYPDVFFQCLKDGFIQASLKALASLRTTVSANTCSMYTELATALGTGIDPFCETIFTNLLRMAGFTKKIAAQQSQQTLSSFIQHASAHPRILLPLLWNTLQEKTVQSRIYVPAGGLELLEKSVKKALGDPNPAVRESARGTFWVFDSVWHDRATMIIEALDATARRQLEKMCPDPNATADLPPTTPSMKKGSVAAAIAASRAKAKAIANAPPTLRHQATSTSRTAGAASPPSKGSSSPSSPSGQSVNDGSPTPAPRSSFSPRSSLSPPTPPRSRILSNNATMSRSTPNFFTSWPPFAIPSSTSPTHKSPQVLLATSNSDPSHVRHALPSAVIPVRQSIVMPDLDDQDSLLLATTIPMPDDSDSDMDESANIMSFSMPYKLYPPASSHTSQPPSFSPSSGLSTPNTVSNALSDSPGKPSESVLVEDALRSRAEQAQSAAERLLELTDPDAEDNVHSAIPISLLLGSSSAVTPKPPRMPAVPKIKKSQVPPVTPDGRNVAIFRQAALFKNSPMNGTKPSDPLITPLQDQNHENGWWSKRASSIERGTPLKGVEPADRVEELQNFVTALEDGNADIRVLQKLALLCSNNPIPADTASPLSPRLGLPSSPSPFILTMRTLPPVVPDMWTKAKSFDRLFDGLLKFLDPTKDAVQLEYALIVVWEILENQAAFLEGREGELFSALFRVRYCNTIDVLEATKTIRDALCSRIEPVYGLTTMHSSLRGFLAEPALDAGVKAGSQAFGLIALGKFILRLPTEVLEEELPRLKQTLIAALNDSTTLVIREAAYAAIIASQLVLRDEAHLFTLLDGLDDNKKNLLTYYFEKHGAREFDFSSSSTDAAGMMKLGSQMGRLDKIMNTPVKGR